MTLYDLSLVLYNLALLPIVFFSMLFVILAFLNLWATRQKQDFAEPSVFPHVTVQIPTFNDSVAVRCIEACLELDYPHFDIMIVDDSTDENTQRALKRFARRKNVSYVHREDRSGYKPGALQEAMPKVKGEIITIFDADFIPHKDFLRKIVAPFEDPKVGIVQGRQAIFNDKTNLVTRFAAYLLMIHHTIILPINNRFNAVFFCGTGGAIRKKAIEDVGGWNARSITEDTELSVRIIEKGYKTVYVPFETPSEVPETLESFLKQQMRWSYGNMRVFLDNARLILFSNKFSMAQRGAIGWITLGNLIAPAVLLMTFAGLMGWFLGDPRIITGVDVLDFAIKILVTSGFLVMGALMLVKNRRLSEFPKLLLATVSVSLVLAAANTVAIYKAIFRPGEPLYGKENNSWICTPKIGNRFFGGT